MGRIRGVFSLRGVASYSLAIRGLRQQHKSWPEMFAKRRSLESAAVHQERVVVVVVVGRQTPDGGVGRKEEGEPRARIAVGSLSHSLTEPFFRPVPGEGSRAYSLSICDGAQY